MREYFDIAKQDPIFEEVPVAFPRSDEEDLDLLCDAVREACAAQIADFNRPGEIICLEEFPRSTLDKISKKDLRSLLQDS